MKVTRPGPWGNPYVVGKPHPYANPEDGAPPLSAEACVALFRDLAPALPNDLGALRGKNLACWCRLGEPCHADVLLELANQAPAGPGGRDG